MCGRSTAEGWRRAWLAVAVWLAAVAAHAADGKPPAAPSLKEIKAELDAADDLLAAGRPSKAAAKLASALAGLEQAAAAERVPTGVRVLIDRSKKLKSDLELDGADVADLEIPSLKAGGRSAAPPKPALAEGQGGMKKTADEFFGRPPPRPAAAAVSFSQDVAPVLVRSCGSCHISGKKGGFQFTNYAELMQTGVVQKGAGEASRLVEVILSGDMPRGGGKVAPDEIGAMMKWIDAGATFDGPDPRQPMALLGGTAKPAAKPVATKATIVSKLEPGAVSFSIDVAPVLMQSCYACHGVNDPQENFTMKTFDSLLRGGRSGVAILAGRGSDSLLVKKLKGKDIEGQRMPLNRKPLADDVIAMIQRWIDEGARLDVRSSQEELPTVAAIGRARKLPHEELLAVRLTAAKNFWGRSLPDEQPEMGGAGDVRVIGNLSAARTKAVTDLAESAWSRIQRDLTADERPLKGGLVVFALNKSNDFSEFWQVRFGTERPKKIGGVGGLAGDIAYAALVVPADEAGADAELQLTEQMVAAVVAARSAPRWFADGLGRATAARFVPRAPLAKTWRLQIPEALAVVGSAEAILTESAHDAEAARIVAGGFVGSLDPKGLRMRKLLEKLDADVPFEQAFAEEFGGPPEPLLTAWAAKEAAGSRRR